MQSWVAVKEFSLSYYIGETLLFTIYIPIIQDPPCTLKIWVYGPNFGYIEGRRRV